MKQYKLFNVLKIAFITLLALGKSIDCSADYLTTAASEEYRPATCALGDLPSGALCRGSNCDNTYLRCSDTNYSPLIGRDWKVQAIVYYDRKLGYKYCSPSGAFGADIDGFVTGLASSDDYGKKVSIECSRFLTIKPILSSCSWTPYFSEEGLGEINFGGRRPVGINCWGDPKNPPDGPCDYKRFYVCEVGAR